jgi:hypothetical protein
LAESITEPPWQNASGPSGTIEATGRGFTVTVTGDDVPTHPLASVAVTVNVPLDETVID